MRKKLTLLFTLLCVSVMGWAGSTPYCGTTSPNAKFTFSLSNVSGNLYRIQFDAVGEEKFGSSPYNINCGVNQSAGAGIYFGGENAANWIMTDDRAYFDFSTASETSVPTEFYGNYFCFNKKDGGLIEISNFSPEDIDWTATCGASCDDSQKPSVTDVNVGDITYNSAVLTITANDNVGVTRYVVKNGDVQLAQGASNVIILTGLTPSTAYDNIKVFAYDACNNESDAFSVSSFNTEALTYCRFATGHLGQADFGDPNGRILLTLEKLSETSVKVLVEPNNPGTIVDYVFARVNGVGKTIGERSASSTENIGALTLDEVTLPDNFAVYIEWHTPSMGAEGTWTTNEFNVQKSQLYVESASGAANPHLTLTNPTKSSILLPKGENITVTYTSENEAAASIESSATGVASVSGNVVTAASAGTATITVSQAAVEDTWQEASVSFEVNTFDWNDISFISSSDYKLKASSDNVNIVNTQPRSAHNCIYVTLPNAVGLGCSLTGNYETEGAGIFIYTDAFTVRQTPFTISWNGNTYDCYVYYNLDETAPVISGVQVTSHNYEQAIISITADEAFVSAEVFNNGVSMDSFTPSAGAITVTGLTAATAYDKLTVKVTDAAGNVSEAANVPEFTTSDAPTITAATYNGYSTDGNFFVKYAITRNPSQQLEVSAEIEWLPSFGGVNPQIWKGGDHINLTKSGSVYTGVFTNEFEDATNIDFNFRFEYSGGVTTLSSFSYTVGSEQAAPASIPAGAVVLNKTANSLTIGETDNLTATVYPSFASNNTIAWSSDDDAIASVDNGTVTANAEGTTNITATCGEVSAQYTATVTASLEEAKFYGAGAFTNFAAAKDAFAYEYCFTRATDHNVTLEVVFSEDMSPYIGTNNFRIFVGGNNQEMTYNAGTKTATYDFGAQSEGASINYYFYFIMEGGAYNSGNAAYTVGSANDKAYACVVTENNDNAALLAAYDSRTAKVIVDRSFEADNLYTLVLPFDADAEQTAAKLPGQLTKLNNTIIKENGDLRLNFVDAEAIEAGVPYLYQPSADVVNPVFEDVTVSKDLNPSDADDNAKYFGIYAPTTGVALKEIANAYVLGSDQYLYATSILQDAQPMSALRGYFVLNFPSSGNGMPRARVIFNNHEAQTTTGIEEVQNGNVQSIKVLRDGQLLIIRDSKTYNAQGQLVK